MILRLLILLSSITLMGTQLHAQTVGRNEKSAAQIIAVYEAKGQKGSVENPCPKFGNIQVNVYSSKKPIVLVLSSYECIKWKIVSDPDTKIQKIILNSHHQSKVSGVKNVPIVSYFLEGKNGLSKAGYLGTFPFDKSGPLPADDFICQNFPDEPDCDYSEIDQLILKLLEKGDIVDYRKIQVKYIGKVFEIK